MEGKTVLLLTFGPHTAVVPFGPDREVTHRIIDHAFKTGMYPIKAAQAAYDLYGMTSIEEASEGTVGSLEGHHNYTLLQEGCRVRFGEIDLMFKRASHAATAFGHGHGRFSSMLRGKTSNPIRFGRCAGLFVETVG